jgi:hypothetical protein
MGVSKWREQGLVMMGEESSLSFVISHCEIIDALSQS